MKYEFDEESMNSTSTYNIVKKIEKVYEDIDSIALFGSASQVDILCQPCQFDLQTRQFKTNDSPYNIPIKDKTLEVLENEFALKYPGPHKVFRDEQDRKMIEFIQSYTKNHEEKQCS